MQKQRLIVQLYTGAALTSMLEFFQAIVKANLPGLSYQELLTMLVAPVNSTTMPTLHKQVDLDLCSIACSQVISCEGLPYLHVGLRE